jgi:cytochrome c2
MKRSLVAGTVLAVGLGFASARADEGAKPPAERGPQVYAAQKCMMCHSIAGKGNARNPLDDVGSKMSADDLKKYITAPKSVKPDSKMKAYPTMPAADLDALVAYLKTLIKKS